MSRLTGETGVTMAELLTAMAVTAVLAGAVLALGGSSGGAFRVQPEVQDLQQRLRGAVEALRKDLSMAGAGTHAGAAPGPLHRFVAPVRPYRVGDVRPDAALGVFHRADTISLMYVPSSPAQAVVRGLRLTGSRLTVDAEPNCGQAAYDSLCGFQIGTRALVFDRAGRSAIGSVSLVDGHTVHLDGAGIRGGVDPREAAVITEVAVHVYSLGVDPATRAPRLMHYDGRFTELPAVDHVVGLRFEYLGDPVPPQLYPGADPATADGPWTTYGPVPPPVAQDRADPWPMGENCTFSVSGGMHVPRLGQLGTGRGMVPLPAALLVDGPWCPDAAHPDRFDADLLRIRRVRVLLRIEAAPAWLRGPAGPFFSRAGTAPADGHRVADVEIGFDVAPRNLNLEP